jgi:hypothetical protein
VVDPGRLEQRGDVSIFAAAMNLEAHSHTLQTSEFVMRIASLAGLLWDDESSRCSALGTGSIDVTKPAAGVALLRQQLAADIGLDAHCPRSRAQSLHDLTVDMVAGQRFR